MSLAHCGVLFLDELPEFSRRVLETLRQPLEAGLGAHRARRAVGAFPARVTLVGAMNPCPCGFPGDRQRICRCPPQIVERYQGRLSGPMRDRFDLSVDVQSVPWSDLRSESASESTAVVRERVAAARAKQRKRQEALNSQLDGRRLKQACALSDAGAEEIMIARRSAPGPERTRDDPRAARRANDRGPRG